MKRAQRHTTKPFIPVLLFGVQRFSFIKLSRGGFAVSWLVSVTWRIYCPGMCGVVSPGALEKLSWRVHENITVKRKR